MDGRWWIQQVMYSNKTTLNPRTNTLAPVRCQRPPLKSVRCLRPSLQSQGTTAHTRSRLSVSEPRARRPSMSWCGNSSHPRPDAKSLQAADSCSRGGQQPAGHHCAQSPAVSAPPRCGVMLRTGGARERERERTLVWIEDPRCDQQGGGTRTCSVAPCHCGETLKPLKLVSQLQTRGASWTRVSAAQS